MMRDDVKKVLQVLKIAYPHYYKDLTETNAIAMLNLWELQLKDCDAKLVEQALHGYIRNNKYPPTVAGLFEEIDKLTGSDNNENWLIFSKACKRASAITISEFEQLPAVIKNWVGDISNLREFGKMEANIFNTVTRGQFLKETKSKASYNLLNSSYKQIGEYIE